MSQPTDAERVTELESALHEILDETRARKDNAWKLVRIENIAVMTLYPRVDVIEYWTGDKQDDV